MSRQHQGDLVEQQADLIESFEDIVEELRAILVREGDGREILRDARVALSDWYMATYPHLFPDQTRPRLRVIEGGGEGTGRLF